MRVMARISVSAEEGNKAIQSGSFAKLMEQTVERWKPEATYFTTFDGKRTFYLVLEMPDSSGIPSFAEPFFETLNAQVDLSPVMNMDDLQKGLSQLG
jgi:hypothetical protein